MATSMRTRCPLPPQTASSKGDDTFCFDGSVAPAPEASPARASVSAGKQLFVPGALGIAPMEIDAKYMRRHRSR